ncbi:MAG: hypothetical protein OEW09_00460, partial [Anaerolineae bacterium]|nr:hypothetical protein [Anaerolineae bacterium]
MGTVAGNDVLDPGLLGNSNGWRCAIIRRVTLPQVWNLREGQHIGKRIDNKNQKWRKKMENKKSV